MITCVIILSLLIVLFLVYLLVLIFPGFKGKRSLSEDLMSDYAHRGLHDDVTPENSLAAFQKAVDAGFGIELDVQLSKDGEIIVFHDYDFERMTGDNRAVKDLTGAEIKKLRLKGSEEKIPLLSEVLEVVAGKVPLLIELKGEDTNTALCPKVIDLLSQYSGAFIIESFNPMLLWWFKKNAPTVRRGLLTTNICKERGTSILNILLDSLMLNVLCRPDFVAYDISCQKFSVGICKKLFLLPVFVWTVRSRDEYDKLTAEVHAIFEGFIPQ